VVKRILQWLSMVGVVAAIMGVQALGQGGTLAWIDRALNSGRVLVPAGIALVALGAVLVVAAMIHGLVTDPSHQQIPLTLDGHVGSDTTVEPGKVAASYRGRTALGGQWVLGYFRGRMLWGAEFHEESGMSELKHSWRSGEWLHVHRYLRATVATAGLLLALVGALGTAVLLSDITAVRLLLLLVLAYALIRTANAFARA
jgi:hypothetical protein